MLDRTLTIPAAWTPDTVDPPATWYRPLSPRYLAALEDTLADWRARPRPITELQAVGERWQACTADMEPVLTELETGRGFVVLNGLPQTYGAQEKQAAYWLFGQLLGRPFAQNVQGTLLYDVRDTGQDVRYGARFSVTTAESTFHTDNSFGAEILDYVGLLCLQPARAGGLSQMVSAVSVHNVLRDRHADVLPVLYETMHVDRRGGVLPGQGPTVEVPIFAWDGKELLCRYLRYWIEVGHEKIKTPLTPAQKRALDTLDAVAADKLLQVEFALRPGDMYFINNRWIMHNRTGYDDYPEPERKRHLIRIWLRR